jgi:ankyrin repeat protein
MEFVKRKIQNKIQLPQSTIPGIHKNVFERILNFLEPHHLCSLAQTSPALIPSLKQQQINIAREFGFICQNHQEAVNLLKSAYKQIEALYLSKLLPTTEYFVLNKSGRINRYRSLRQLSKFPNDMMFSFLTDRKYYFFNYSSLYRALRPIKNINDGNTLSDDIREKGNNALIRFSNYDISNIVKILLMRGISPNIKDAYRFSPLHLAARYGCFESVEVLVAAGATIDEPGDNDMTPLHCACFSLRPDPQIVKLLLRSGANPNAPSYQRLYPLHYATKRCNCEIILALIDSGARLDQPDGEGNFPLHYAARRGKVEEVKCLLDAGAKINVRNKDQKTPLSFACGFSNRNKAVIELLIHYGANIQIPDIYGLFPIHLAALSGLVEIIGVLIQHGVDVNLPLRSRSLPLHLAAQKGHLDVVKFLLNSGSKINERGWDHQTALCHASRNGYLNIVEFLLQNGADPNIPDKKGNTALHLAAQRGNLNIVEFLLVHGVEP